MTRNDWIIIFLFVIIIIGSFFFISYYFTTMTNECLSNPLIYGAKQMEENYGYKFNGYGYLDVPQGYKISIIYFNSTNITIK